MLNIKLHSLMAFIILSFGSSSVLHAVDIVKLPRPQSIKDIRFKHKNEILRSSLELTKEEFGDYEIRFDAPVMQRGRALEAMKVGDLINVYFSPPKKEWMENTTVIHVPIRRGILSYRLLLINRKDLKLFENINSVEELKKLKAGVQHGWSTTEILEEGGFDFVKAYNFDGLFYMLESHRFNYLLRGSHEIFDELNFRKNELKNVVVEPTLAIYLPTPTYTYVSPGELRLSRRINMGMEMMVNNGDMKKIFDKYYLDDLKKAKLHKRKIIEIKSNAPIEPAVLNKKEYWFGLEEGR